MHHRHWPVLGALAGLGVGVFDYSLFAALGVDMTMAGRDVTLAVVGFYALSFAAIGWLFGRVAAQKARIREQSVALTRERARAAQYEKLAAVGRLAAGVAHEVRNPLAVIKSSTALLAESVDPRDEGLQTAAAFVDEEIDRLDAFITALLDYARPRPAEAHPMAAAAVLERLRPLATAEAERRGVTMTLEDRSDGAAAPLDAEQLSQALFSLVVNAAEAEATTVRLRALPGPAFEVADDGPGIGAEDAAQVFEPFFTTKARGTGLGLAMAARIAEAHDGRLRLARGGGLGPGGRGACFHLSLESP